jgi:four helix bundle protein
LDVVAQVESLPECNSMPARSQSEELRERTKKFAIRIVRLFRSLQKSAEGRILGRQLLRSGTSVAANYRACCRARSRAEFIAKIGVVVEEADETVFWLELLIDTGVLSKSSLDNFAGGSQRAIGHFCRLPANREARSRQIRKWLNDPITH